MTPCELCKGACCHYIVLPITREKDPKFHEWLKHRGEERFHGISLRCKCQSLTKGGRCKIYDERPEICRDYEVGCIYCVDAIKRHHELEWQVVILEAIQNQLNKNQ